MENREQTTPVRRVGTLTFGVTLVAAGVLMIVSLFYPLIDLSIALKVSPVLLILLGIETLLAARGGGKVKYDWVGMVLCFVIVCAALCLYAVAWWMLYGAELGYWF